MKNSTKSAARVPSRSGLHVDETVSLEEQIAKRAHELWQQKGRHHGSDLADWLQAEREVNEWHHQRLRNSA